MEAWSADLRVDEAVDARARTGWLRRRAGDEATFLGVLTDLAERGATVVAGAVAGPRTGRLRVVGRDFLALRTDHGHVLVPYEALAWVRPAGDASTGPAVTGDRVVAPRATFAGALSALADERVRVRVVTRAGALTGELRSVGVDVVVLRLDDRRPAYAVVASLVEVSVVESG